MSEYEPTSLDDAPDGASVETSESSESGDRTTRWLVYATLVAAIAVFALLAWVMYSLLVAPKSPRTAAEKDMLYLQSIVQEKPGSPSAWGDYVQALTNAEQYGRAERALRDARSAVGTRAPVLISEAKLDQARDKLDDALTSADAAVAQALAEYEARQAALLAQGNTAKPDPKDVVEAHLTRARVLVDRKEWEEAAAAFGDALEYEPSMADVLVERGDAYLEVGDAGKARADFERALEFIPDMEEALQGLDRTGAVTGQ